MNQLTRSEVEVIAQEVMMDEIKKRLFDYEEIKEELRQLNAGERVALPKDKEHAKFMLIIAMNYLGIKPGEPINYGNNNDSK